MISPGIVFDNTNNYGILKTESVIEFVPNRNSMMSTNTTHPLEWWMTRGNIGRTFSDISKRLHHSKTNKKSLGKKSHKKKRAKTKKCIYKLQKKKKKKNKHMMKKYMIPLLLGFLAAKSLVIPIAFKAITFMYIKALLFLSILKLIKI